MRERERERESKDYRERGSSGYVIFKNCTKTNLIQIFILLTKIKKNIFKSF
jgi:hypothetical protein